MKSGSAQKDAVLNELRTALQQVAVKLAATAHSMCWLTSRTRWAAQDFKLSHIEEYDREVHSLIPEITGHRSMIAAIDPTIFDRLTPLVHRVLELDAKIGLAASHFSHGQESTAAAVGSLYEDVQELEDSIPMQMSILMKYSISH